MLVWEHAYHNNDNNVNININDSTTTTERKVKQVGGVDGVMHFKASDIGEDILAYVVDNSTLRYAIFKQLAEFVKTGRLNVVQASVNNIEFSKEPEENIEENEIEWPRIELSDGSSMCARLIAACDGSRSRIRTMIGADWIGHLYGQRAVVANVGLSDASCTAWQRFVDSGPVALLPTAFDGISGTPVREEGGEGKVKERKDKHGGPMANVVWTMTDAEALALVDADDAVFLDELNIALTSSTSSEDECGTAIDTNPHLDTLLSQVITPFTTNSRTSSFQYPTPPTCTSVVGKRTSFPLSAGHAPRYVIPEKRTVLVGDAAHSVHPLAGQGVNLGFADARALADCIAVAAGAGRDIGGEGGAAVRGYESERVMVNVAAVAGLHGLRWVFGAKGGRSGLGGLGSVVGSFRRAGLSVVDGASPVKRAILNMMR